MIYNISKNTNQTIINTSDGNEYVVNEPKNFYKEGINTVIVQNCFPNLVLTKDNCTINNVVTTSAIDIMTKLKAIQAFNPYV